MSVHPPKEFAGWTKTKQKAWTDRWGQKNNIGKVLVDAKVPAPKALDVHHPAPEKKRVLSISPGDESAPSGVERGRRSEGRAQKLRDAEQRKVDKKLADEVARDKALQKARLERAAANKAAADQDEATALAGGRTASGEGLEAAKKKRKR